ncbi:lasso peptide biosynthesis PqqD family chaperone [Paenibacillus sp. CC-CFT747]|nr:lasso peptide biosynthesis PqqD family chaperone [Paenibacillus sp. CC-CFT747]
MTNQTIARTDRIIPVQGNIVSNMGGEKVMLSIHNSKYYNLGEIGGKIWELLEKGSNVEELVTALTEEYAVEPAECEEHVASFLQMLHREGLIQIQG